MKSVIYVLGLFIAMTVTSAAALASLYDCYYTSTVNLTAIGQSASTPYSVYFRYDTNATPEQILIGETGVGFARYWVDGSLTVGEHTITFSDGLMIVANDRSFLGGDAFAVTNLIPGTTLTGQIYGYTISSFYFELRDSDYQSIDSVAPPEGNTVLDNFDWNDNAMWLEGGPNIKTTDVAYTINAVLVPESATVSLLAVGGLALLRKRK